MAEQAGPEASQLASPSPRPRAHAHVTSHTPGRLRVRVHHPRRHRELMHAVKERLEAQPGTGKVQVDPHTGSVLVHYDPHTQSHVNLLDILGTMGLAIGDVARGLDIDAPELSGRSKAGDNIVDSMTELDRQIALLTGHKVDLKLLFPAALGGIGLWRAMRSGLGVTEVPAYVLLWYAFDSFWKFHREPATPPDEVANTAPDTASARRTTPGSRARATG